MGWAKLWKKNPSEDTAVVIENGIKYKCDSNRWQPEPADSASETGE